MPEIRLVRSSLAPTRLPFGLDDGGIVAAATPAWKGSLCDVISWACAALEGHVTIATPARRNTGDLVAQSSGHEARVCGGEDREQLSMLYGGIVGAAILSAGLWIMRGWLARAASLDAADRRRDGAARSCKRSCVITALVLFSTRVDRASEEVASTLDALAAETSDVAFKPRGARPRSTARWGCRRGNLATALMVGVIPRGRRAHRARTRRGTDPSTATRRHGHDGRTRRTAHARHPLSRQRL